MKTITVGIIGAASAVAEELLKILFDHPAAKPVYLVSETYGGKPLAAAHPRLAGLSDLTFEPWDLKRIARCDLVFLGRGHGESTGLVRPILKTGARVIDLSADFRLRSQAVYERWYQVKHQDPALLTQAVFGLPEVYREKIRKAKLVANPGCYVTSVLLGLLPVLREKLVAERRVIADSFSGISGAGKKPTADKLLLNAYNNLRPYNFFAHRHVPEMEQELSLMAKRPVQMVFTPHVAPFNQGILTTLFIRLKPAVTLAQVARAYAKHYRHAPFVRVAPAGTHPELAGIVGTNFCDLGFSIEPRTRLLAVTSTLDNLVKGASGQAVENMNLMFGLPQWLGLKYGRARGGDRR